MKTFMNRTVNDFEVKPIENPPPENPATTPRQFDFDGDYSRVGSVKLPLTAAWLMLTVGCGTSRHQANVPLGVYPQKINSCQPLDGTKISGSMNIWRVCLANSRQCS